MRSGSIQSISKRRMDEELLEDIRSTSQVTLQAAALSTFTPTLHLDWFFIIFIAFQSESFLSFPMYKKEWRRRGIDGRTSHSPRFRSLGSKPWSSSLSRSYHFKHTHTHIQLLTFQSQLYQLAQPHKQLIMSNAPINGVKLSREYPNTHTQDMERCTEGDQGDDDDDDDNLYWLMIYWLDTIHNQSNISLLYSHRRSTQSHQGDCKRWKDRCDSWTGLHQLQSHRKRFIRCSLPSKIGVWRKR